MKDIRIYVGNLKWSIDDDELYQLFSKFGDLTSATVVINRDTRSSRGFGFVTFSNESAADKAVSELNGQMYEGRKLIVSPALPEGSKAGPVQYEIKTSDPRFLGLIDFLNGSKLNEEIGIEMGEKYFAVKRTR